VSENGQFVTYKYDGQGSLIEPAHRLARVSQQLRIIRKSSGHHCSMHSTTLFVALLASSVSALSLPPLIPLIPGVTEPLSNNAPPLPILQVPTPPLESPPHQVNTSVKPKKIGYFWTAAGDNKHKDFLATYSLDDDTFGTLLAITDVPSSGNSPHHLGSSLDGKTLVGGGLLSLLKTQVSYS
jgi:YD repeat-containing protein